MSSYEQVDALIAWLKTFDPNSLSEDDVETNFVLPFFEYLGYSNAYRRGKYPIHGYQPGKGKGGRKPEIDQIYFSVDDRSKQDSDTSLLLVEVKKPQVYNLEKVIKQAKYYGNHLVPLFLAVTDGHRLIILKRHRHRGEEIVFDDSIHALLNRIKALEIYKQLQFDFVKQLKEQGIDPLTHALYTDLISASHRYPDLQTQLAKGDFEPSTTQEKRRLTVIKSTVAITCELPIAFTKGSCSIEFSNIMLRGLTCHLSHSEILENLLLGLSTSPHWKTRRFLEKMEQDMFKAHLGQTTVILSEREACELCEAVDEVGQRYKDSMIESANILETWDFPTVTLEGVKGCRLLSVGRWLWDLMKEFSYEFDYDKGNSDWHIFDSRIVPIRLTHKDYDDYHVVLWPKVSDIFLPSGEVDIIYNDCITERSSCGEVTSFENVGPLGFWTATYTKAWIVQQFIPKVLIYYLGPQTNPQNIKKRLLEKLPPKVLSFREQKANLKAEQLNAIMKDAVDDWSFDRYVPLNDINEPKQFEPYVDRIQSLFHSYGVRNIPASILRPYYAAFADLAQYVDPATIKIGYIQVKLGAIRATRGKRDDLKEQFNGLSTYSDILNYLNEQAIRILEADYEGHRDADLLSRVFSAIVGDGVFHLPQSQLNAAKRALCPLWDQCRFEAHFVEPILLGY